MTHPPDPLRQLALWLQEEGHAGNRFAHGAVLATVGADGQPHSRMMRVTLGQAQTLQVHASVGSRKVSDVTLNTRASLTFAFQGSLRAASLEGRLQPLDACAQDACWAAMDAGFRRRQWAWGASSGQALDDLPDLDAALLALPAGTEQTRPQSFIAYALAELTRAEFYTVRRGELDLRELYQRATPAQAWQHTLRVP